MKQTSSRGLLHRPLIKIILLYSILRLLESACSKSANIKSLYIRVPSSENSRLR